MDGRVFLLGFVAIVPLFFLALGLLTIFGVLEPRWFDTLLDSPVLFPAVGSIFIGGLILCIVDVWRNPRVPHEKRALWTVVLLAANWYALPFYFWFYVRRAKE